MAKQAEQLLEKATPTRNTPNVQTKTAKGLQISGDQIRVQIVRGAAYVFKCSS